MHLVCVDAKAKYSVQPESLYKSASEVQLNDRYLHGIDPNFSQFPPSCCSFLYTFPAHPNLGMQEAS